MNAPTVRRIRLPADHSSPGLAREAIRTIVHERDLGGILDEALLLVTELTTNSVVHAGTEVDVEITAADASLTVTVLDFRPGTVVPNIPMPGATAADLDERGRGLLLALFITAFCALTFVWGLGLSIPTFALPWTS